MSSKKGKPFSYPSMALSLGSSVFAPPHLETPCLSDSSSLRINQPLKFWGIQLGVSQRSASQCHTGCEK